jgi:hypothetical protein
MPVFTRSDRLISAYQNQSSAWRHLISACRNQVPLNIYLPDTTSPAMPRMPSAARCIARHSRATSLKGSPRARRSLPAQRSWAGLQAAVERLLKQIRDASDEANPDTWQFSPQGLFEAVVAAEYRRKANTAKK